MNSNNFNKCSRTELLTQHLKYVMRNSQFYQRHFAGIDIEKISLESLAGLPLTSKADFEKYNHEFLACPQKQVVDMVHTSGTSGHPTYVAYTENDLRRLEYNEVTALGIGGITKEDSVLLTCTIDRCFIAGLAYFLGCRGIGATAIRNGANTLESHLRLIKDLQPTAIIGVPSFLQKLAKFANKQGLNAAQTKVSKLICIGEPLRNSQMQMTPLGKNIEDLWQAKAFSTYASTETITSFCECEAQHGGHLIPELGIVEIVDEEGNLLKPGQTGEVVMTPLQIEAMPLVRYRTGDIGFILDEHCSCGRKSLRLSPIIGRKYQMIKCRGTKFYPPAVNAVLDGFDSVRIYQLVVRKNHLSDEVKVLLSLTDDGELSPIKDALRSSLRMVIDVELQDFDQLLPKVFPDGTRKPVKYIEK